MEDFQQARKSPVTLTEIVTVILIIFILIGLLIPSESHPHPPRFRCTNNLEQLSLAMMNYEADYGCFPPAYTVDAKGNRLHSWRTLLLPYLWEDELYQVIDFSKPWGHPVNSKLSDLQLDVFECPAAGLEPGSTTYTVVDDPAGIFNGSTSTKVAQIADGPGNTLLVVEVDNAHAIPWMSPTDIDMKTYLNNSFKSEHEGGANCALADGSVHLMPSWMKEEEMEAMATKSAGDTTVSSFRRIAP
ncbi:MAG: DUF1559 domain-containing protein [Planctomycetota bacterium]